MVPVPGLLGELDAVVCENGVNLVRHRFEHVLKELPRRLPVCLLDELGHGELAGAVNADKEMELPLGGLNLGDVDVEEPDRVAFELLALWFVPLDIRQAGYAMPLKTSV